MSTEEQLIDPAALHDLPIGQVTVLDVRWKLGKPSFRVAYLEGHVPGAVFVDLESALSAPVGDGRRGRHPLPDEEVFGREMRAAGVNASRPVVVYDESDSMSAARAWWLLRYFGHEDVRILDGGLSAWTEAGLPLASGEESVDPGDFTPEAGGMALLDADTAAALAKDGVLLDARAGERYRGETEPIDPVAGHIPHAVSAPTGENVDSSGRFRGADELRERFAGIGVTDGDDVGAYCGSGVTAAHEVFALALAGFPGAALYAGSWSEWVSDPTRPVATGATPEGSAAS
ncbi:MAG TPA: sulfurtransferase [Acidimicrobiales bacterium]|nr:sulfurtransferase [Acidimicrobiales bacterium]